MAKLTRDEIENIRGEEIESLLNDKRIRLSTSPFGATPGKVVAFIGKAVRWKKRGHIAQKLHLSR